MLGQWSIHQISLQFVEDALARTEVDHVLYVLRKCPCASYFWLLHHAPTAPMLHGPDTLCDLFHLAIMSYGDCHLCQLC